MSRPERSGFLNALRRIFSRTTKKQELRTAGGNTLSSAAVPKTAWIAEDHPGRHPVKGRAGLENEYSENVPSDLEFLGGGFSIILPLRSLEEKEANEAPGLTMVKKVMSQAWATKSWDLAVQPFDETTIARGKNAGKWRELMRFPAALHKEFTIEVHRLWCRSIEIYWRLPFDGLLQLSYPDGGWCDVFVSAVPGVHGFIFKFTFVSRERSFDLDLDKLGFTAAGLQALKQAVDAPKGMVLLSGPTHSGKSIVCCSALLRRLRGGDRVTTIERPRKFRLPGARQILLSAFRDYDSVFPGALENDPQVLMVQDLCSYEEFAAALKAAGERLLVAATHMNDVLSCLRRLHNYGGSQRYPVADMAAIQPYRDSLAANLSLVCSGRLVTKLCPSCRTEKPVPAAVLKKHGIDPGESGAVLTFERGRGCDDCRGSGFLGRTGIYEVLPVSPAMRRLLSSEVVDCALIRQARDEGLLSLREAALRLAREGVISFEEAVSATPEPYHTSLF
jgi:type IV pilus assembly protein PilB